jgi:crossover junction endodeoxyribonuclease RuvC
VRILGIDPGSVATGWGIVDCAGSSLRHVASGVLRPPDLDAALRLARIHSELVDLVRVHAPHSAALEAVFVARNPRAALKLGQARGVALAVCGGVGLPTTEYAPARVKGAVAGYGGADKAQVQAMVRRLLGLERLPPRDAADALAIAICHGAQCRTEARRATAVPIRISHASPVEPGDPAPQGAQRGGAGRSRVARGPQGAPRRAPKGQA